MKWHMDDMRSREYFNHLSYRTRIKLFLKTKKKRFFCIFLFVVAFNFIGNVFGFTLSRLERFFRKAKKNWIMKKNPNIITYQSAVDTLYQPQMLSA